MAFERAVFSSALRPGAVMGEIEDGRTNVIASLDDLARGEVAGYNARNIGQCREIFPRISRSDYQQLSLQRLPEEPGLLEEMLSMWRGLSEVDQLAFCSSRKMVRQEMPDGTARLLVVPRVPEAATEVELLALENAYDTASLPVGEGSAEQWAARAKKRTYTLAQVLSDNEVLPKYGLSPRAVETAKRVAATDPAAAATLFQAMMNASQETTRVYVKAGEYSRDKVQARNAVRQMCRHAPRTDAAVESLVMMDEIVMFGPGGEGDWHVSGPLKSASEVSFVYWLVRTEGCIYPSILLAMELVLLGINIFDGKTAQEPELEHHASMADCPLPPLGVSERVSAMLSVSTRMQLSRLVDHLVPVMSVDGSRQLATAVRVSGRFVLVNSHVLDADPGCTVNGVSVVVKSQLSRDLCSVRAEGLSASWNLRTPVVGEMVMVCYLRDGQLSTSAPLKVTSTDASCIVTMLDSSVMHGMSGGALVAVDDLALLGVHSAATLTNLIAYRFGEQQFSDLLDSDSVTTFSRHGDVGSFAEKVSSHFRNRGLWGVLSAAMNSLEPVFVGNEHVGMAVHNGADIVTTCDAEQHLQLGQDKRVVLYESDGDHYYRTPCNAESVSPMFRRAPNYFEKVFVLGYDDDVYMSAATSVLHVGPNARNFVIADLPSLDKPVRGGLVVAWDGAVLGCCGPRSMTTAAGLGYVCWPLDRKKTAEPNSPRAALAAAFPFLNLVAWSDELLEETFTHSSAARYKGPMLFNAGLKPLANIGDNVAKAELYKTLRDSGLPHSQWSGIMQSLQSNVVFAASAWKFNFANALVVGNGVSMQPESKAYADLTEALIGAVSLMERPEVVTQFCLLLGVVYVPARPDMTRRPSELDF